MRRAGLAAATLGLLLAGAAASSRAQSPAPFPGQAASEAAASVRLVSDVQSFQLAQATPLSDSLGDRPSLVPQPHRTLELDSKGRWGVRLDMEQPSGRAADWQDVQAGAYVSLGSRLRVGGTVGFGDKFANPQRITPQDAAQPRVRLETQFKF